MQRSHCFNLPTALPTYYVFFPWLWSDVLSPSGRRQDGRRSAPRGRQAASRSRTARHPALLHRRRQPARARPAVVRVGPRHQISCVRRDLVASVLRIDDRLRFIELVNRRHARMLLALLADMTAKDDVTSVVRFDHSCRVTLDAMFTETLSVLIKIADAAESLTDQAHRLLCDINTNTFMCIVDSLL